MSGRRKLPEPLSAGDAFWQSIVALPPDDHGRTRWERASHLAKLSIDHLKKCASGERPIRLDDAARFDLINSEAGGPASNEEALQARRLAALEGTEIGIEPARYIERAIQDITEAARAIEFGKGNLVNLRGLFGEVHKAQSILLDALSTREAEASRNRERRSDDLDTPRLVSGGQS